MKSYTELEYVSTLDDARGNVMDFLGEKAPTLATRRNKIRKCCGPILFSFFFIKRLHVVRNLSLKSRLYSSDEMHHQSSVSSHSLKSLIL